MNELKSVEKCSGLFRIETCTFSLSNQTKFRLNENNKIKTYFEPEIKEQEAVIKKLIEFVASLNYTDKVLIVLSATSGGISIFSHVDIIGKHAGTISSTFIVVFSLITGVIKKLLIETRKNKKNIVKLLC